MSVRVGGDRGCLLPDKLRIQSFSEALPRLKGTLFLTPGMGLPQPALPYWSALILALHQEFLVPWPSAGMGS